jgi:hypothetical protein
MRFFLINKYGKATSLLFFSIIVLLSCSDEFNLFEDQLSIMDSWKETAAVYANINMNGNKHFIRVNRGFTSENYYDSNTNPDSIYFNSSEIEVRLFKLKVNSIYENQILDADTLEVYYCNDTIIEKDSIGSFSVANVVLYFAETNNFSVNVSDDLYIGLEIITPENKITGHTKVIESSEFLNPGNELTAFPIINNTFDVEIVKPIGSHLINLECVCTYKELVEIEGIREIFTKEFSIVIGSIVESRPIESYERFLCRVNTGVFYKAIEVDILTNGDTVNTIARAMDKVFFRAVAGNEDFAIFHSFSSGMVSGFSQDLPTYSNINNGVGFVSGYNMFDSKKLQLSYETIDTIINLYGDKYYFQRILK